MFKRYALASLVGGLALAAQSAVAGNLWFYEGHGWLAQPPFSSVMDARGSQPAAIVAPSAGKAMNPQTSGSPRTTFTAPYNTPGGYFS